LFVIHVLPPRCQLSKGETRGEVVRTQLDANVFLSLYDRSCVAMDLTRDERADTFG